MTTEEKAKRYDEIIKKANKMHSENCEACKICIEELIPELAESEDERIRKEIINFLKHYPNIIVKKERRNDYITWLEMQGEHANFRNKIQVGDKVTRNEDGVLVNLSQLKRVAKKDEKQGEQNSAYTKEYDFHGMKFIPKFAKGDIIKDKKRDEVTTIEDFSYDTGLYTHTYGQFPITIQDNYEIIEQKTADKSDVLMSLDEAIAHCKEKSCGDNACALEHKQLEKWLTELKKLKEQKSVDKVEPKFHEGEWIIFNGLTLYVNEVVKGFYRTISIDGIPNSYDWDIDNAARLWTIQEAKDGNVLACENGWTCIFKTLVNNETFSSYCFMDKTKWFCETGSECHTLKEEFVKAYNGKIYPATKEQCDQLEKAMADAGYTFDFDKKELKKIEQL